MTVDLTSDAKPNLRDATGTRTADWNGTVIESAESAAGNNTMVGNDAPNSLLASEGNDSISGGGGDDGLSAKAGDDTISGGEGDDGISGGAGDDYIDGVGGKDTVDCGDDNDYLQIQRGSPEPLNCETVVWFD